MQLASHNIPKPTSDQRPAVTVFCAVWHKQPNKLELLKSHWENLKQQTLPVEPCYIFDNGDTAPEWLQAPWHSFSEPLTIYEAWAAAVALTDTRYVMNLNMDDRLATDAVELMLLTLQQQDAALVGGEWIIDFDNGFQMDTFGSSDSKDTSFAPAWPPAPLENGASLRLGSGTGERGTMGPATLWDLEKTDRWYPSYFGNREPILSMGDSIFWTFLGKQGHRLARLPVVVGRYFSSINTQAEFRGHNDKEKLKQHGVHHVSFAQGILAARQPRPVQVPASASPVQTALPTPRNTVEARSQELALKYLAMFGRGVEPSRQPAVLQSQV